LWCISLAVIKVICQDPEASPKTLVTLNLEPNQLDPFIDQIKMYGITWETTNVSFKFVKCGYAYYPVCDKGNDPLYFKVTVEEKM